MTVSLAGTRSSDAGTVVADRVADILVLFTREADELGVTEIARRLDISKAVVHRILQSLVSRDLLAPARAGRAYRLGTAAAVLGVRALGALDMRAAAAPILRQLRIDTAETVTLSRLVGRERVYIDQIDSPHEITMTVGLGVRHPLHAGASGKAMLAYLDSVERDAVLSAELPSLTADTVVDRAALADQLTEIRARGVATSFGERLADAAAVAAPVLLPTGEVYGAVSVCGPRFRFDEAAVGRWSPLVKGAATAVSRAATRFEWTRP
ncbi:MAG: IclR family transcriptional regulator [Kutzneria sp.]|nr:IclR family transcriptional regulator [Kutzneria sp.]MBV9847240.1 IclR family transcriptional regulator [Kutzneria sp.]